MIAESHYYKDDLLHFVRDVRRWLKVARFTERRWYEFERGLLSSCLCVRRLVECHKVANELASETVEVEVFDGLGKPVTIMNRYDLLELYDVENPKVELRSIGFVVNQIIHSFVLSYWRNPDRTSITVFFSSDRERNRRAHSISTLHLFQVFEAFGSDYPDKGHFTYNEARRDYEITLISSERVIQRPRSRRRLTKR